MEGFLGETWGRCGGSTSSKLEYNQELVVNHPLLAPKITVLLEDLFELNL